MSRSNANKSEFVSPFSKSPIELNKTLKSANGHDFREKYGNYIQKFGGLYNPGFSFDNLFEDDENQGWNKFLGIIKNTPLRENTFNVIKSMKAKKKILESVSDNKNKKLFLENENILKWYAFNKFFKDKTGELDVNIKKTKR